MKKHVENLIQYEIKHGIILKRDYTYVKNQLYHLLQLKQDDELISYDEITTPADALDPILDTLIHQGKLNNSTVARDLFDAKIMNIFASLPSVIEEKFYTLKAKSKSSATDYLYNYAKSLNYIRYDRILKNKSFTYQTNDIHLEITINLSKPEKDPKDIIAASKTATTNYPTCVLCKENEGFSGNISRDSRDQHRLISLNINNQEWFFQYSPYIYYNEHAIVLSKAHTPMKLSKSTFENLIALVDQFEGYFFGSNADLPIVGGSILSHEHYQGGKHKFPIEDAKVIKKWQKDNVTFEILKWPLSTVRLKSKDVNSMVAYAEKVMIQWQNYTNQSLGIHAYTDKTPHNTLTPIARFKNRHYELDLVLRNNRTTPEHPLGIFHPHADKHHIKKENIGLIEAIGLAILPARLIKSISELKANFFDNTPLSEQTKIHLEWFEALNKHTLFTQENFDQIINQAIGNVFESVLNDCGVFKHKDVNEFITFVEGLLK